MFTVTRLLLRKSFDEEFFRSTIYVLIGFLTYDLYIDNLLNLEDVMTIHKKYNFFTNFI